MKSLVKSCALAAILSLAMATTARATQLDSKATTSNNPVESQGLIIAQKDQPVELGETSVREYLDEMIRLNMRMVAMSEKMLSSQQPEIRKMAQEMMTSSNAQIVKLVNERERLFRANRLGR